MKVRVIVRKNLLIGDGEGSPGGNFRAFCQKAERSLWSEKDVHAPPPCSDFRGNFSHLSQNVLQRFEECAIRGACQLKAHCGHTYSQRSVNFQ